MREPPSVCDVVVVGAGTAGCVVAGRLAERQDLSVVLLEAGADYGPSGSGAWPADLLDASRLPLTHDWGYSGPAADGRLLTFERARVMGGCSTHNGCTQSWGWGGDYDGWAADGLVGWSATDVEPWFRAATEKMRISRPSESQVQPFQRAFIDACELLHVPRRADLDDLNGGVGVDLSPVNIVDSVRWNTSFAYVDPVRDNGHLTVIDDARVRRIIFDVDRAVGVQVLVADDLHEISCAQVIVAAGAYGTPELLMRSGVGAASELAQRGLGVVLDQPLVGENLHDHSTITLEFDGTAELKSLLDGYEREHGWLPEEQAIAKVASDQTTGPYDLHIYPWVEPSDAAPHGWMVVLPAGLVTPKSRGRVTLNDRDPMAAGAVDHCYLSQRSDVSALSDGLSFLRELAASTMMQPLLGDLRNGRRDGETEEGWMKRTHTHYWHPAGTAAMSADEASGVCDAAGRVHGVSGLIVADASLFPQIPRATPALPVVVAGEIVGSQIA